MISVLSSDLNTNCRFKAASWVLENKNGNVQYYFEVEFNFQDDWQNNGQ